jgi:RNA methyltransferase, TrmH family
MITSPDNDKLKTIRRLADVRNRRRTGLFVAEGEDLVEAAIAAGVEPVFVLEAGVDVDRSLLDAVSSLGSGTRVVGVYRQRFSDPHGSLALYLHGVSDPGNVGTIVRSAHALCDGPVVLGPDCADPYGPKAIRASMGSVFARPPARVPLADLPGTRVALDPAADRAIGELAPEDLDPPVTLSLGAEREGLPEDHRDRVQVAARIPLRPDGPESLNVAMAAAIALHELGPRVAVKPPAGAGPDTRMATNG